MYRERIRSISLCFVVVIALFGASCVERKPTVVAFVPKNDMGGFDAVVYVSGVT